MAGELTHERWDWYDSVQCNWTLITVESHPLSLSDEIPLAPALCYDFSSVPGIGVVLCQAILDPRDNQGREPALQQVWTTEDNDSPLVWIPRIGHEAVSVDPIKGFVPIATVSLGETKPWGGAQVSVAMGANGYLTLQATVQADDLVKNMRIYSIADKMPRGTPGLQSQMETWKIPRKFRDTSVNTPDKQRESNLPVRYNLP